MVTICYENFNWIFSCQSPTLLYSRLHSTFHPIMVKSMIVGIYYYVDRLIFNRKVKHFFFFWRGGGLGLLFFILFSRTVVRRRLVVTSALCQCKQSLSLRPSSNKAPHALILYPSLSKYWIKTSLFSLILNASYNILYGESEKKITVKVKIQY